MRVYLPATFSMLDTLEESGLIHARSGWGFAVTPELRSRYEEGEEEEFEAIAFDQASEASIRLLAFGDEQRFPHRRVVVSVDVKDECATLRPDMGASVVELSPAEISVKQVAAIHIDVEEAEEATKKAIEVVDEADLGAEDAQLIVGDALDNYMAFYDPSELPFLIDLM